MMLTRRMASILLVVLFSSNPSIYANYGYSLATLDVENFNVTQVGGTGTLANISLNSPSTTNRAFVDSQEVLNKVPGYNLPQVFAGDPPSPPPQSFQVLGPRPGSSYAYADQSITLGAPAGGLPDFSTFHLISESYVETPHQQSFASQDSIIYAVTFSVVVGPVTLQTSGTYTSAVQALYSGPVTSPPTSIVDSLITLGTSIYTTTGMPVDDFSPADLNRELSFTGPGAGGSNASGSLSHTVTLQAGDYTLIFQGESISSAQSFIPVPEPSASSLMVLGSVGAYGLYLRRRKRPFSSC